jgi:SSS family solute:Na+ symporter
VDTPISLGLEGFENGYEQGSFLWIVSNIYFQYYSLLIFLVCAIVMVVVSHLTEAPSAERLQGLTYGTITSEQRDASRGSWDWRDILSSIMVLLAILAAYLYFRG